MFGITAPIIVLGRKKKRAIRRAVGLISASCHTNKNGITVYNQQAAAYLNLTLKEVNLMREILPVKAAKRRLEKKANQDVVEPIKLKKVKTHGGVSQPVVDRTTTPPKRK